MTIARQALVGVLLGAAIAAVVIGAPVITGDAQLHWDPTSLAGIAKWVLVFLAAGAAEEYLFRSLLWGVVHRRSSLAATIAVTSVLFGLFHAFNKNATVGAIAALAVEGVFYGVLRWRSSGLAMPIGAHVTWNVAEGLVFGAPVSGMRMDHLWHWRAVSREILTGGKFGPEAAILRPIIVLLVVAAIVGTHANWSGQGSENEP